MDDHTLQAFRNGDGAHCGLSDWYPEKEAALSAALDAHQPFDTGWYSSKKQIASARIWSSDGIRVEVEVSVSDDFDTNGRGEGSTDVWALDAISKIISSSWSQADDDRLDNAPYEGFSIHDPAGRWVETYLVCRDDGYLDCPPGDNYHWWGWQHDEQPEGVGIPDPSIPAACIDPFETFAHAWERDLDGLTIEGWTIRPWRD